MTDNIAMTTDQLNTVLYSTENSNNPATLRSFSWANSGESSYSFGVLQFDVGTNHGNVQGFLRDNGFTDDQIAQLSQHGGLSQQELAGLDRQLQAIPQATMDTYVNGQLQTSVNRIDSLVGSLQTSNPDAARAITNSPELQLALADYDNQFVISGIGQPAQANTMLSYLQGNQVHLPGGNLQASDPLTRTDIQNFINATRYGVDNPTSVANRETRLTNALDTLQIAHAPAQGRGTGQAQHGGTLREGDHNDSVRDLQHKLNQLNPSSATPLQEDGRYGPGTREAVESFQRAHPPLTVDGRAGPQTIQAIDQAVQQQTAPGQTPAAAAPAAPGPQINDPAHPGNALYQQARNAIYQLDAQHGRTPDQLSDNLAAAAAVQAHAAGMTRIDHIVLSDDSSQAWAVQGNLNSPFKQYTPVGTEAGMQTSLAQSTAAWNQVPAQATPDLAAQQSQQQAQGQQPPPQR